VIWDSQLLTLGLCSSPFAFRENPCISRKFICCVFVCSRSIDKMAPRTPSGEVRLRSKGKKQLYTYEEVAKHDKYDDLWLVLRGMFN
jgi:hypothetical protein